MLAAALDAAVHAEGASERPPTDLLPGIDRLTPDQAATLSPADLVTFMGTTCTNCHDAFPSTSG